MKGLVLLAAIGLCCLASPYQRGRKGAEVQILQTKARRSEDKIVLDGRIRAGGEKPLKGLVLAFDFLSDQGEVLTTEKEQISDDTVDPGDELPFHAETLNPPGSIRYRIRAFDGADRELHVGAGGPYIID